MPTSPESDQKPFDNPFERLEAFQGARGFFPASYRELSEALALVDPNYSPQRGGAARHLNEILFHQQNETQSEDPSKAVRAVTQEYVAYFKLARGSYNYLKNLGEEVENVSDSIKPTLSLARAVGSNAGFGDLVHFVDLRRLAIEQTIVEGGIDPLGNEYLTNPTPLVKDYIAESAQKLRIKEVRSLMPLSIADQRERASFWKARLEECQRHTLARPIAKAALRTNIVAGSEN
jgi:hypothetical protein